MRLSVAAVAFAFLAASCAFAQSVISAHSGVVQYIEGRAFLDGQPVELKSAHFPDIKQSQELRTEDGRAEILLTPGVFLRIGEDSGIRMLSNGLTDTRVEVLKGSAVVECDQIAKDNSITLVYKDTNLILAKHGLYRVDTNPARLQVYEGEAIVKGESGQLVLKGGKETELTGALAARSFDKNDTDELYRWANRRASYVAQANVVSASAFNSGSGYGYGYTAVPGVLGNWSWNPLFGLFTMVPADGMFYSPFGYPFFSPVTVVNAPYYGGNIFNRSASGLASSLASRPAFAAARASAISPASSSVTAAPSFGGQSAGFSGASMGARASRGGR